MLTRCSLAAGTERMGLGPSVRAVFWEGPRDTVPQMWLRVLLA